MAAAVKTAAAEAASMETTTAAEAASMETTTTTEASSAPAVASGPSCVSQGDRCDAD
jgi:hypothetical protein